MKKPKFICTIVVFIAISLGVILFFSMASTEGKQDYFEGKVLENSDDYIVIKINSSYEKLISKLGENVKIEKTAVVKECDFSKFISNESVRVLWNRASTNWNRHVRTKISTLSTLPKFPFSPASKKHWGLPMRTMPNNIAFAISTARFP